MPKGWTVEVAVQNPGRWGNNVLSLRLFDVAIEDRAAALDAVRHHAAVSSVVRILEQTPHLRGLSRAGYDLALQRSLPILSELQRRIAAIEKHFGIEKKIAA